MTLSYQVFGRQATAFDVIDFDAVQRTIGIFDQDGGQAMLYAIALLVDRERQGNDDQPIDVAPQRQRRKIALQVFKRINRIDHKLIVCAGKRTGNSPKALNKGWCGKEGS